MKKLISTLLVLAMLFAVCPLVASAEEATPFEAAVALLETAGTHVVPLSVQANPSSFSQIHGAVRADLMNFVLDTIGSLADEFSVDLYYWDNYPEEYDADYRFYLVNPDGENYALDYTFEMAPFDWELDDLLSEVSGKATDLWFDLFIALIDPEHEYAQHYTESSLTEALAILDDMMDIAWWEVGWLFGGGFISGEYHPDLINWILAMTEEAMVDAQTTLKCKNTVLIEKVAPYKSQNGNNKTYDGYEKWKCEFCGEIITVVIPYSAPSQGGNSQGGNSQGGNSQGNGNRQ